MRRAREAFPRHTIAAGNVVTAEMTEELLLCGADIVKIGIGPGRWVPCARPRSKLTPHALPRLPRLGGSVCTTRRQTGVGYPQLSALLECADAAHGLNGHIISDGGERRGGSRGSTLESTRPPSSAAGCTCPGDVAKAFGAGADFVMLGACVHSRARQPGGHL